MYVSLQSPSTLGFSRFLNRFQEFEPELPLKKQQQKEDFNKIQIKL